VRRCLPKNSHGDICMKEQTLIEKWKQAYIMLSGGGGRHYPAAVWMSAVAGPFDILNTLRRTALPQAII
jgi:hypothetical protein